MCKQYICSDIGALNKLDFSVEQLFVYRGRPIPPAACIRRKGEYLISRFFYIIKGSIEFTCKNGDFIKTKPGDLVYLPGDVVYQSVWDTAYEAEYITFHCQMKTSDGMELLLSDRIFILVNDNYGEYHSVFTKINDIFCSGRNNSNLELKSLFYSFLSSVLQKRSKNELKKHSDTSLIYKGIVYIENNFISDTSIAELAEMCNVSESTFRRMFKDYKNMAPARYRNKLRLEHSRSLLETGLYTVGEVAEIVNFSDISHFNKSFKNYFGFSPSKCKNNYK